MEIRNLYTFTKVAEAQSLSKAARQLGYAQSTVTMQMQQLEQELGVPIYERVGKQIRITQEGQELLKYAVHIVRMSEEALQIGKGPPEPVRGSLRLGVIDILEGEVFAKQIHHFARICSEVELDVRRGSDSRSLISQLLRNDIDLMVTLDHRLSDPVLVHAHDQPEGVHFVAAPDHPLAGRSGLGLEEILRQPLIREDGTPYGQELGQYLPPSGSQMMIQSHLLAVKLALRKDGILLAPDSLVQEYVDDGRLVVLDCEVPGGEWLRQTLYHKNKWRTDAMNAWIHMLEEKTWE